MKNSVYIYIAITVIVAFFGSCSNNTIVDNNSSDKENNELYITIDQFNSAGMEIGEPTLQNFEESIICNGTINATIDGIAVISSQISGIIKDINFQVGSYIKKGDVICTLSSKELVILQQEYLETSATLNMLKIDYERSQTLYNENIGSKKDLVTKEGNFRAVEAVHKSLRMQLELLKLDINAIEEGNLYSFYKVTAPISGIITKNNIIIGQYIEPEKLLVEIINDDNLHARLSVFQSDISNLKIGQEVKFNTLNGVDYINSGKIISIGKIISRISKTITCIADIKTDNDSRFTVGSFIEAKIIIDSRKARALPTESIIKSDNKNYILILSEKKDTVVILRKVIVEIGDTNKTHTEILGHNDLKNVIVSGVYNMIIE